MSDENIEITRDYVDTFSIKDQIINKIAPKYFPDIELSKLPTGTLGIVTETIANITEDAFNTGSSLVAESFPTRAKMETSIYSNAAIFQLSNTFATPASCEFLLAIPEADIQKNFISKGRTDYKYFYIDRDTIISVKDIPFTLDYDIEIRGMYRESQGKWVYTARYLIDNKKNTISDIRDPYIHLQVTNGTNPIVILKVTMLQYTRDVNYEPIVDNATLNYPVVKLTFGNNIAGFDVFYKAPGDVDYSTQLEERVIYALPSRNPFCYYRVRDGRTLELSFTTKDAYFQPKFNSELEIVLYTTLGKDGEFEYYDGTEISIQKGNKYQYESSWLLSAKPVSASTGAKDSLSLEALRALTVEAFTTANAITTEHDLQVYFNNYKYRYDTDILIVKKRNDGVELLFSTFLYIKKDDYIFPTNTLTLDTNIRELDLKSGGYYNLDPGYVFRYKGDDIYRPIPYYMVIDVDGNMTGEKYSTEGEYYNAYGLRDATKDVSLRELNRKIEGGYVKETDHGYWKMTGNVDGKYRYFDSHHNQVEGIAPKTAEEIMGLFIDDKLTYDVLDINNYTIDFVRDMYLDAGYRKDYIEYFDTYRTFHELPNMSFASYLEEYSFEDYKADNGLDSRVNIFKTDLSNYDTNFLFTNPFIITVEKDTGIVSYYQSFISQDATLDFLKENTDGSFVQFITYTLHVSRDVSASKAYNIKLTAMPSIDNDPEHPFVTIFADPTILDNQQRPAYWVLDDGTLPTGDLTVQNFNHKFLELNSFRIVLSFKSDGITLGYMELVPTAMDEENNTYDFEGIINTDDYVTSDNMLRITHICPKCGHEILNSANAVTEDNKYYCDNCHYLFKDGIINIRESDTIQLNIAGIEVEVHMLYGDPTNMSGRAIVSSDNDFAIYDDTYNGYVWANVYSTLNEPIVLMKPMNMMRSAITYKDYMAYGISALDCTISDIPLLKYSVLQYRDVDSEVPDMMVADDVGKFQYFMDAFLNSYSVLQKARSRMNGINIDIKFYNTYGKSTNYQIGEDGEVMDTNNIAIYLDCYLYTGTDVLMAENELKTFIKNTIETVNESGSNDLYISNLITAIESNFAYVHHIHFKGINDYDSTYQAIINKKIQFTDLSKNERRNFVPDMIVINRSNIYIKFYQEGD